jgi:hypothetical protein
MSRNQGCMAIAAPDNHVLRLTASGSDPFWWAGTAQQAPTGRSEYPADLRKQARVIITACKDALDLPLVVPRRSALCQRRYPPVADTTFWIELS